MSRPRGVFCSLSGADCPNQRGSLVSDWTASDRTSCDGDRCAQILEARNKMVGLLLATLMVPGPLVADAPQPPVCVVRAVASRPTVAGTQPTAIGIGHPPPHMRGAQARLMAKRAAEVRAVRNLADKLGRGPRTTIRGFRYVTTTYRADGSIRVVAKYAKPRCSTPQSIIHTSSIPRGLHHHRRNR